MTTPAQIAKSRAPGTGPDIELGGVGSDAAARTPKRAEVEVHRPLPSRPGRRGHDPAAEELQRPRQHATMLLRRRSAEQAGPSASRDGGDDHGAIRPHTQTIEFGDEETDIGMALHRLAAGESLTLVEAELKYQQLQKKDAARRALLADGPKGSTMQVLKAIVGDGLNLGMIASLGFNGWNVTAQLAISQEVRKRLPPHLSPAEREAVCGTVAFLGASFAAGFGALTASVFSAPLFVGAAQQAGGAWEIQKQDLELLFPNPDPYVDRDNGVTKSRREYDAELQTAVQARTQCEAQQGSFGLATKKALVLITGGFWIFHSARIGITPLQQSPWAEGPLAGASSFFGAGLGMAWLSTMKWRSHVTIPDDASDTTRPMKIHFVAEAAPEESNASAFVSKFDRTWKAFADGRQGKELAVFMVAQWLKLSASVHAATVPTPMIQAAAAVASDGASDNTQVIVKMGATAIGYAWALFVLLVYFPAIAEARVRPQPPSDEEPLLGINDEDADQVLRTLLDDAERAGDEPRVWEIGAAEVAGAGEQDAGAPTDDDGRPGPSSPCDGAPRSSAI
jgi:hypothetical protein